MRSVVVRIAGHRIAGGWINSQHLSVEGINQLSAKSADVFLWPDNAVSQGLRGITARVRAASVGVVETSSVSCRYKQRSILTEHQASNPMRSGANWDSRLSGFSN